MNKQKSAQQNHNVVTNRLGNSSVVSRYFWSCQVCCSHSLAVVVASRNHSWPKCEKPWSFWKEVSGFMVAALFSSTLPLVLPETPPCWPALEWKLCCVVSAGWKDAMRLLSCWLWGGYSCPALHSVVTWCRHFYTFFFNHPFQNDLGCSLKVCNTLLKHLNEIYLSTFVAWLKYWFFQSSAKMAQESAMTMKTILEKVYVFAWRCCQSNEDFAIT